jgi:hypothetical protein
MKFRSCVGDFYENMDMGQVVVFWVVISCSDEVEHQRFGGPYFLHLQVHPEDHDLSFHRLEYFKSLMNMSSVGQLGFVAKEPNTS